MSKITVDIGTPKIQYVLGFLFREDRESVVLIRKEKPQWQAGLLSGVGGKVEAGETPIAAMLREFEEETGVQPYGCSWRQFCTMRGPGWEVICFEAKSHNAWLMARTSESESIEKPCLRTLLPKECVSNLPWLIGIALDDNGGNPPYATVEYQP